MNYYDDIYPFNDNDCCRKCCKSNTMVLSAVSKLQSDYDKIAQQLEANTAELKRFDFKDVLINIQ